jgi:tetratricopeptide (TPR) repeat protein
MGVPLVLGLLQVLQAGASPPAGNRASDWEQRIHRRPSDLSLYAGYASYLITNRAYEPALGWIEKGLAISPSDTALRLRQAIALHALGRFETSLDILKTLPATAESRFYMGLASRGLGDHKGAQQYLSEAWESGVRDPYALYSLIEEDHAMGDKAAGLRHYQLLVTEFPDSAWLHVLYANAYAHKNQDADARREYEEALRRNADLPGVNFRLGYLLYRDNQYGPAAECFRKELALNPAYADASLFLAQTLRTLGQDDEAIGWFRKAIALDPRSDLAYRALAGILTEKNDLTGAAAILRQAEAQFPADPGFPAQLAKILTRLNREDEALQEQQKFRLLQKAKRPKPVGTAR